MFRFVIFLLSTFALLDGVFGVWKQVTNREQLWRYLLGSEGDGSEIILGRQYMILIAAHGDKLLATNDYYNIYQSGTQLGHLNYFEPIFMEDGTVALMTWNKLYISRQADGQIRADRQAIGSWEKFIIEINENEDRIAIKSHAFGNYFTAQVQGHVTSDGAKILAWEQFRGWKKGSKEDWSPIDYWELISSFDNLDSSAEGSMRFARKIGMSTTETESYMENTSTSLEAGLNFGGVFSASVSSTTGYNWGTSTSQTFKEETTLTISTTVPPRSYLLLYQAFGKYGPFTVKANHFKNVEMDKNAYEISRIMEF